MSKNINVNPNFYKVGGREHSEGRDKGVNYERQTHELAERHAPGGRSERARMIENARGKSKKK
jgi:hypothetical protein